MGYDVKQFRDLIERTLTSFAPSMATKVAVDLLLGTAAQESAFGRYLRQLHGPAVGAFQMEPATFEWLQAKYSDRYPEIDGRTPEEMEWDLRLAIIMARLRYRAVPLELPEGDVETLAAYWKRHYNTPLGRGTTEEYIANYRRFGIA
jgi:hypothetical protein